jgi:hypothetical protein
VRHVPTIDPPLGIARYRFVKKFVLSIDTEQIPKAYGYPAAVVTNLLSAMPTNYNLLQKQPVF